MVGAGRKDSARPLGRRAGIVVRIRRCIDAVQGPLTERVVAGCVNVESVGAGWRDFEHGAPDLAGAAVALFERYEVVILGTNTRSGHPRLSLVEPVIIDGELGHRHRRG